jgi:hypothetical protein
MLRSGVSIPLRCSEQPVGEDADASARNGNVCQATRSASSA